VSDPRGADVGVGQKIFRTRSVGLGCTLISYVDDRDIIVQSPDINTNCIMLRHAYKIVFKLMTA
jgi:hypothetical protein